MTAAQANAMTDDEVNRRILTWMGYQNIRPCTCAQNLLSAELNGVTITHCSSYTASLDACHEAEKKLSNTQLWRMTAILAEIVPAETPITHAAASQRSRALVMTLEGEKV